MNEQMRLPQEGGQSANFSTNFSYGQTNYKNTMGEFIYVQGNLSTTSGRHQMDRSEGVKVQFGVARGYIPTLVLFLFLRHAE